MKLFKSRRRKDALRRALRHDVTLAVEKLHTREMLAAAISSVSVDGGVVLSTVPEEGNSTESITLRGETDVDTGSVQQFFASPTGDADPVAFDGEIQLRDRVLSGRFQLTETPDGAGEWRVSIVAGNVDVQLGDETGIRLIDADGVFVLDPTGIAGRIVATESTDDMEVFGRPGLSLSSPFAEGLAYELNTTDRAIDTRVAIPSGDAELTLEADIAGSLILDQLRGPVQFSINGTEASVADIDGYFTVTEDDTSPVSVLALDATDIGVTVYAGTDRIAKLYAGSGSFGLDRDPEDGSTDFRLVGQSLELNGFSLLPDENGDVPPASEGGNGSEVDVKLGSLDVRKARVTAPVLQLTEDDFQFQVTVEAESFQLARAGDVDPANPEAEVPDAFSLSASDISGGLTLSGQVQGTTVAATAAPVFSLGAGQATFAVGELLSAQVTGLNVSYNPQLGEDQQIVAIDELTLEAPALGLSAQFLPGEDAPALAVYGDGFEFSRGRFGLTSDETVKIGPLVTVTAPFVQWNDFSYRQQTGYSLDGVSLGAAAIEIAPESPTERGTVDLNNPDSAPEPEPAWTVSGSGILGTVSISADGQSIEDVTFSAASLNADLGFLTFAATDVTITPTATGDEDLIRVGGSVTATVNAGPVSLAGTASKFSVQGDGDFVADENFQVALDTSGLFPGDVSWPSFLPIQVSKIGVRWADFNTAPEQFEILVSAAFDGGFAALPLLSVGGSVTNLRIDPAKLAAGQNPLIDVSSVTASIRGQLFGAEVTADLTAAFLKLDDDGQRLPDGSLDFAESIFYGGIEGSFLLPGKIGTKIRLGFSERGFLSGYISSESPQGIVLDRASGLTIKNFRGGISFNATPLEKPATPAGLTNPIFQPTTQLTHEQWRDQLKQQVANQVESNSGVIFDFTGADAGGVGKLQSVITQLNAGTFPQRDAHRNPSALEQKFDELGYFISTANRLPDVVVLESGKRWQLQIGDAFYVLKKTGAGSSQRLRVSRPGMMLPLALKSELSDGVVSASLIDAFAASDVALPGTAEVSRIDDNSWLISAGDVRFRVFEETDDTGNENGFLTVSGNGGAFADADQVIRIEAGGTFYSQHVPEDTLSIDAEVIVTTDGKFVVVGAGHFGGNGQQSVLELDAKLFGDLSSLDESEPDEPLSLTFLGDLRPGTSQTANNEPGLSASDSTGLNAPLRLEGELTLAFMDAGGNLINATDQPDDIHTVQLRVVGRGTLKASGVATVIFGGDSQTSGGAGGFAELELNYTNNADAQRVQLDVSGSLSVAGLIQADDLVSAAGQLTFERPSDGLLDIWGAVAVDVDSDSGNLSFLKEAGLSADANLMLGLNLSDKEQTVELDLPGRDPVDIELDALTYVFEAQGSLTLTPDLGPVNAGFVFDGAYSILVSLNPNDPNDLFDDTLDVEFFLAGGMNVYFGVAGTALSDLRADVLGVMVLRDVGLQQAPKLAARLDLALGAEFPGFELDVDKAQFLINTTSTDVVYEISDRFTERIDALQQRRDKVRDYDEENFLNAEKQADGSYTITINGAATSIVDDQPAPGPYAQAEITGSASILNSFVVDGEFRMNVGQQRLEMQAVGMLTVDLPGAENFIDLEVGGTLVARRNGLYGNLFATRAVELDIAGVNLGADTSGQLKFNTTSHPATVGNEQIAARSAAFLLKGRANIAGFQLDGSYGLTVSSDELQMLFDAKLAVAGFPSATARGTARIVYSGSRPGLILNTALQVDGQNGIIPFGAEDIFQLKGNLFLNIDTTRDFGQIAIRDLNLTLLNVINFEGEAAITAGFDVDTGPFMRLAGNFRADLFNVLKVDASGFFDTRGAFDVDFDGEFGLGSRSWGIRGGVKLDVSYLPTITNDFTSPYTLAVSGGASGRVRAFGRTFASAGLDVDFNSLTGRLQLAGSVRVLLIRKSVRFGIGYLPIQVVAAPRLNLATLDADGTLNLNVGARAAYRGSQEPIQDEDYAVEVLRHNAAGGFDVRVFGMGESRVYTGVKRVKGDFGDGNDFFRVIHRDERPDDLIVPIDVNGGSGDDQLLNESPGGVLFYGNDGSDVLIGGSGNDLLHGGAGDDFIVGNAGIDTIIGDAGSDEILWVQGDGQDVNITGGDDSDHLIVIGGNDSETLRFVRQGNALSLTDGATQFVAAGEFERVSLFAEGGGDRIEIEDLSGIGLETLSIDPGEGGRDAVHILGTEQADQITVANLHDSQDPITINGFGLTIEVNVDTDRSDQLVLDGRAGNDALLIQPGAFGAASRMNVTLRGGDGNDTLTSAYTAGTFDGGAGQDVFNVLDPQSSLLIVSPENVVSNRAGLPLEVMRYLDSEVLNVSPGGGIVDVIGTSVSTTVLGAGTTVNVKHVDAQTSLNLQDVRSATLGQQGSLRRIFGAVDVRGDGTVLILDTSAEVDPMNLDVTGNTVTGLNTFMPAADSLRFGPGVDLSLKLGTGDDYVTANDLTRRLSVDAGPGQDTLTAVLKDASLDGSAALSTTDVETVTFRHSPTVASGTNWQIVGNTLQHMGHTVVETTAAHKTIYNLSDGPDTLSILGGFDHLTEVDAGAGHDILQVADPNAKVGNRASYLALMTAPLILHGGAGTDAVHLNDQQNPLPRATGSLDLVRGEVRGFDIPSGGGVDLDQVESFVLNTGDGDYDVTLIDSDVPSTINFGAGADTVTINDHQSPLTVHLGDGDDVARLRGSHAALTLDGGDGIQDEFRLDFSTLAASAEGELTDNGSTGLSVAGFANLGDAAIAADAFEEVDVTLTPFNDSLTVDFSSDRFSRVSLNGIGGDDRYLVKNVGSPAVVNAGSGQDIVTVAISGDPRQADDLSTLLTFDPGLEALTIDNSDYNGQVDWKTAEGALSVGNAGAEQRLLNIAGIPETRIISGSGANRLTIDETADRASNVSISRNALQVTSGEQILDHADFEQPVFTTPIEGLNGVTDTAKIGTDLLAVSPEQNNLLVFPEGGGVPQRLIDGTDTPAGVLMGAFRVEPYADHAAIVISPDMVSRFLKDSSTGRWGFDGVLFDAPARFDINEVAVRDQHLYLLGENPSSLGIWRPDTGFVLTDLNGTAGLVDLKVDVVTGNAHVVTDQSIAVVSPSGNVVSLDSNDGFRFGESLEQVETSADGTRLYVLSMEEVDGQDKRFVNVYAREIDAQGFASKHLQRFEVPATSVHLFVSQSSYLYLTQRNASYDLESVLRYELDGDGRLTTSPSSIPIPEDFQSSTTHYRLYAGAESREEDPNKIYLRRGSESFTISDDPVAEPGREFNNGYGGLYSALFSTRTVRMPGSNAAVDIPFNFFQTNLIIGSGVGGNRQAYFASGHPGHFVDATISVALSRDGSEYHFTAIGIAGDDLVRKDRLLTYQFTISASEDYDSLGVPVLLQTGVEPISTGITAASHARLDNHSGLFVASGSAVDIYDVRPTLQYPVFRGRVDLPRDVLDLETAHGSTYALLDADMAPNSSDPDRDNRKISELSLHTGIGYLSTFVSDSITVRSGVTSTLGTAGGGRLQGDAEGHLLLSGDDGASGTPTGFVSSYLRDISAEGSSRFDRTGTLREGDEFPGQIKGMQSVTVSADGTQVYAVDPQTDALVIFEWDSDTDTFVGQPTVLRDQVGGQNHLGGAARLALHPNDRELFVVSDRDRKIVGYVRDPSTNQWQQAADPAINLSGLPPAEFARDLQVDADGDLFLLTNLGIHRFESTGGTSFVAMTDPTDVQLTHNGLVLVTQGSNGSLQVLNKSLTVQKQIDGVTGASSVWHDAGLTIVAGGNSDSLFVLDSRMLLDTGTTASPLVQTIVEGHAGVRGIAGASKIVRSASGDFVFVTGRTDHTLAAFRVEDTGNLQYAQFLRNGASATLGLFDASSMVAHPVSDALLVGSSNGFGFGDGGLSVFAIDQNAADPVAYNIILDSAIGGDTWTNATINTGSRGDRVSVREAFRGDLSVNTAGGPDFADLANSGVLTVIDTGSGSDLVELRAGNADVAVTIRTGDGDDAINIRRTGMRSTTTISTAMGADRVTAQGSELTGPVTLHGGDQGDTLTFFAAADSTTGDTDTPDGRIKVSGREWLQYSSIENRDVFAPPLIRITQPSTPFAEGQDLLLNASESNLFGNDGTFEWDLNNDGVFGDVTGDELSVSWSELVAFGINDQGVYPLSLRLSTVAPDGQTLVSEQSVTFEVTNAAPILQLDTPAAAIVGADFQMTLAAFDPGNDIVRQWTVNWGDNTSSVYPGDVATVTHRYQTTGTYTVTVTATDEDTSVVSSRTVTINPAAPQVETLVIAEGQNLLLQAAVVGTPTAVEWFADVDKDGNYTDADRLVTTGNLTSQVITWQQLQGLGVNDDGLSPVRLVAVARYQDFGGTQQRAAEVQTMLTITNSAPSGNAVVSGVGPYSEGDPITVQVNGATDPSFADVDAGFTYEFDFNDDGVYDDVESNSESAVFLASKAGTQRIRVTITDKDGGATDVYTTVVIDEVAPTLHVQGDNTVSEGALYTLQLQATDPGNDLITSWTVNWDDGVIETVSAAYDGSAHLTHRYRDDGSYAIQVTAVDNDGVYQITRPVTVTDVAPQIAIERADTGDVFEGQSFGLQLSSIDPGDDRIVQWEINWGDGTTEILPGDQLQPTHVYQTAGAYTITFDRIVTDEHTIESPPDSLQIDVRDVAPVIRPDALIVPVAGTESDEVLLSAVASGPLRAVDTLTFVWHILGPAGYELQLQEVVTPEQAVFVQGEQGALGVVDAATEKAARYHSNTVFTPPDNGEYRVELKVLDDDGNVVSIERQWTVSNVAPVIDTVMLPTDAAEGTPTQLQVAASDIAGDADPLLITWTLTNGVTGEVTTLSGDTVDFTPDGGRYDMVITADDGDGGITTAVAAFDVKSVAPRFLADQFSLPVGLTEGQTAHVSALAEDPVGDSDALTYLWTISDSSGGQTFVPGRRASFDVVDNGIYEASVTVTNPQGDSTTSSTFRVDVANVAPSIDTVNVPASGQEGVELALQASASDFTKDALTYHWTVSSPTLTQPVMLKGRTPTFTPADDGTYSVSLTVTDDDDGSTTRNAGTIVVANSDPTAVLQLSAETPVEGGVATLSVDAADVPADIADLTYQWSVLAPGETDPANAILLTGSTVQLPTPRSGVYQITVTVDDGDGGQWTQTADLPVANVAPVINSVVGPAQGFVGFGVEFSMETSDAGQDDLTVSWQIIDPHQTVSTLTGADIAFEPSIAGDHVVRLSVSDEEGGSVHHAPLTLSVAATPISINSVSLPAAAAPEGRTLDLRASAVDLLDDSAVEFNWTITDENGEAVSLSGAEVSFLPANNGVYGVLLTARNGNGSATVTRTIQIDNVAPRLVTLNIPGNVLSHRTAALSAFASDANDDLTYRWKITSPVGTVTELTGPDVRFQPVDVGFHAVELTIDDGDGGVIQVNELLGVANSPPVADAGPEFYDVIEGGAVELDASLTTDAEQASETLFYEWDFDGDGIFGELNTQFGDEVGVRPIFLAQLDGDAVHPVSLRVTDQAGAQNEAGTSIRIQNAPPVVETLISSHDSPRDSATDGRVSINGRVSDSGMVDTHTVRVDWGDGSPVRTVTVDPQSRTFTAVHEYKQGGIYGITVTAIDKDGATSEPRSVTSFVRGLGLNNGTLYIVGTNERDEIDVKEKTVRNARVRYQELRIKGTMNRDEFDLRVPVDRVAKIVILARDGEDQVKVDVDSLIPVFVHGGRGNDNIRTKDGIATIKGGDGDDKIDTGDGVAFIQGGDGGDRIRTGNGIAFVLGGDGDDRIRTGNGIASILGGDGDDRIRTGNGMAFVLGGDGDDRIRTGNGISVVVGGRGNDDIDTGHGWSLIFGNAGDDKINTGNGRAIVFAGDGDDTIRTGDGRDRVYGGNGNDDISTGKGNDLVFTGSGRDKVSTGSGRDVVLKDDDDEKYLALLDQLLAERFPVWSDHTC